MSEPHEHEWSSFDTLVEACVICGTPSELEIDIRAKSQRAALRRALGELPTVIYNSLSLGTRESFASALVEALRHQGLRLSDHIPWEKPDIESRPLTEHGDKP